MSFVQDAPRLGNQFDDDRVLQSYLARVLPPDILADVTPELHAMGGVVAEVLYPLSLADRLAEPRLIHYDAWGNRSDEIQLTRLWQEAEPIAARYGLVATAYQPRHGPLARVHQFALVHLFTPSSDMFSCPLAMTDGAARTLLESGNRALIDRALPRLTSRDPDTFWTSGQWMTELTGGSDVGRSETVARQDEAGIWRLFGRKWLTSAITSQMALTLARPEGNGPGGSGLALFYVETRDEAGRLNGIQVDRLKDKLGTRKLPTAELTLTGAAATPVAGLADGVRNITPMLNVTRLWNSMSAVAYMRRGLALATDYATRRIAFGAPLAQQPLHRETLAALTAEYAGAFHLSFFVAELMGRAENSNADEQDGRLLRVLTPVTKLLTAKQAVAAVSEILECFGGAGYVEDTGLPVLLRDVQVLPIWEGTTNVLALDTLRALRAVDGLEPVLRWQRELAHTIEDPHLVEVARQATAALVHAETWLGAALQAGRPTVEAGARRLAFTIGRAAEVTLLARHAQWSLRHEQDTTARADALRLAQHGIDHIIDPPIDTQQSTIDH